MTEPTIISPLDPAERWTPHNPRYGSRPAAAVGVIEVAGDDRIGSGPRLASEVYWGAGADCDNPVEWWRPWRPEVVGARNHYNDGGTDFFSYRSDANRAQLDLARVFAGDLAGIDLRLADGSEWTVTRDEVKPTPQRDLEYAQNRTEELFPEPAAVVALNLGQIADSVRDMALQRMPQLVALDNEVTALRARRDELLEANNRYQQEARDARADAEHWQRQTEAMARIISDTAKAIGAYISPSASIEFMTKLPAEVRIKMELYRQNIGAHQSREQQAAEALTTAGVTTLPSKVAAGVRVLAERFGSASAALQGAGWTHGPDGWTPPARPARREVIWVSRASITTEEVSNLHGAPAVLIRTDNGIWWHKNEQGGGNGYTSDPDEADTWTGPDAWRVTAHCGPEKEVAFGLIL